MTVGVILFVFIAAAVCWILLSDNNSAEDNSQGFSRTRLEKLEDTVDTVVGDYFNEKYGVEATVTYKGVAGGVFLGPDPSSVQYYHVAVNIADGDIENKYFVDLHGREKDGIDELYVKSDAYYGLVIKEKMEKWLDDYVNDTNIDEYCILYNSAETNQFPSEYEVNATAEEIINSVSIIEHNIDRPSLIFCVLIPQSEYAKHINIEDEFMKLKTHVSNINAKIKVNLIVYSDEDYLKRKNEDKSDVYSDFEQLEHIKIIDYWLP